MKYILLIFICIFLTLKYCSPSEKELIDNFGKVMKDDIEFVSQILPFLCDHNNNKIAEILYSAMQKSPNRKNIDFQDFDELKYFWKDFTRHLKNTEPQNHIQEKIKEQWLNYFDNSERGNFERDLHYFTSILEDKDISRYFYIRFENITKNKLKLLSTYFKNMFSESSPFEAIVQPHLSKFHEIAFRNKAYKSAYEDGCLQRVEKDFQLVIDNAMIQ